MITDLRINERYEVEAKVETPQWDEMFTKDQVVAMLTEIKLDIQEVNTAPQFLTDDTVKDFSECVDTIIQQKINNLQRGWNAVFVKCFNNC